jgi:hypothetical protein
MLTNVGFVLQSDTYLDYATEHCSSRWIFKRSIKCSKLVFGQFNSLIFLFYLETFWQINSLEFNHIWEDENNIISAVVAASLISRCSKLVKITLHQCGLFVAKIILNLSFEVMAQIESFELTTAVNCSIDSSLMLFVGTYCLNLLSVAFWSDVNVINKVKFNSDLIKFLLKCSTLTSISVHFNSQTNDKLLNTISLRGAQLSRLNLVITHAVSLSSLAKLFISFSMVMFDLHLCDGGKLQDQSLSYIGKDSLLKVEGTVAGVSFWKLLENLGGNRSIFSNLLSIKLRDITTQPSDTSLSFLANNTKNVTELSISDVLSFNSFSVDTVLKMVQKLPSLTSLKLINIGFLYGCDFVKVVNVEGNILEDYLIDCCQALTFEAVETIFRTNKKLKLLTVWGCDLVHTSSKVTLHSDICSSYLEAINPELKFRCLPYKFW